LNFLKSRILAPVFLLFIFSSILVSQSLVGGIYESKLVFNFNIDTAFVQFGIAKPSIKKIASGDTLIVSNGFYHIFLSYPTNEDYYITRNVLKDSTYIIDYNFDLTKKTIDIESSNASLKYLLNGDTFILTDEDTQIFIDEEYKTKEYYSFFIQEEKNKIKFENNLFKPHEIVIKKKPIQPISVQKFNFYSRSEKFPFYAVLPGVTYLKDKNYGLLTLVVSGLALSTGYFIKYQNEYSSMLPEYIAIRNKYLEETDELKALDFAKQMKAQRYKFNSVNIKRNIALYSIVGFFTVDFLSKVRFYREIETRSNKQFEFFIEPKLEKYLSMGASINF
tara:strand:+ start:5276 stop:6277 length:1002 start_codon:yes stop_codon:yes gene_type:complete